MSVVLPPSETRKTIRMGLVLSGFLVAFGFMTMLVPIALYHAAQVAAALRLRSAFSWLALVVFSTLMLGLVLASDVLFLGGLVGFLWFPIFVFALYQRKINAPFIWTAIAFFIPLISILLVAIFVPVQLHFDLFLLERLNQLRQDFQTNPSLMKIQNGAETLANLDMALQRFRVSGEFRFLDSFLKLQPSQRILWFLFDSQASVLFVLGFIINSFASLLFLDHAFEQVEKIQAVAKYVKEKSASFPADLARAIARFPLPRRASTMTVLQHVTQRSNEKNDFINMLWRPAHSLYAIDFVGYTFEMDVARSHWWLRGFMLPFALIALSSVFLLSLLLKLGSPESVIAWAGQQSAFLAFGIAAGCLVSVFCLCLTAIQGLLTLYSRLTTFAMAVFVIVAMILVFSVSFNIYLAVGGLAVVGLLDYIYDLRGRLANRQKKS